MAPLHKFCVFCGEKPKGKTKEHIIPQWLIKMTGDPNRKVNFGVDTKHWRTTNELRMREFGFSAFQFPACEICNTQFSKLEADTKFIVEKILSKDYLSNIEISTLLDWFDKIRIGLWLGNLLMDRDFSPVDPQFYIKNRMGVKDRCLLVYELNDDWQGIQFVGFNAPCFQYTPSCFSLGINNFHFFNMSFDYLFSKSIGFPYPHKLMFHESDNTILHELNKGTEKVKIPLIKRQFIISSNELFQPILPVKLMEMDEENESYFNSAYIKANCIDYSNGLGDIFFVEKNSLVKLDNESELCLSDGSLKHDRVKFLKLIGKQVLETQLHFNRNLPSTERLTKEETKNVKDAQKNLIKLQKEFMKLI